MTLAQAKLDEAMLALRKARDAWRNGYRNNWPQQDALDWAITRVLLEYHYGALDRTIETTPMVKQGFASHDMHESDDEQ